MKLTAWYTKGGMEKGKQVVIDNPQLLFCR